MITMNELVDLRMQQHIAHEIYRQQIMQRIPDPFPPMLPMHMPRHVIMPPRVTLPGVDVTLQNDELWKQFHQIGTEMIITKCGRRMFPSLRLSISGLDDEQQYCVLLEMVPIGDCRYKFSGSQWIPAGGAEPQSPQRMCLHPDSPATGAHWQAQPILFSKVKLTNNTLDNNGHIVLASMHKYQPRIHVIRTSDLSQIPWAPQQAFVYPETEFVAVTAYQNDRITKLKIDNNPFAKGFRETGQSRCKRKMSSSPTNDEQHLPQQQHQHHHHQHQQHQHHHHQHQHHQHYNTSQLHGLQQQHQQDLLSPTKSACSTNTANSDSGSQTDVAATISLEKQQIMMMTASNNNNNSNSAYYANDHLIVDDGNNTPTLPQLKRLRSNDSAACSLDANSSSNMETSLHNISTEYLNNSLTHNHATAIAEVGGGGGATSAAFIHNFQQNMQSLLRPSLVDLACSYFTRPQPIYPQHVYAVAAQQREAMAQAAAAAAAAAAGMHNVQHLQPQLMAHCGENQLSPMNRHERDALLERHKIMQQQQQQQIEQQTQPHKSPQHFSKDCESIGKSVEATITINRDIAITNNSSNNNNNSNNNSYNTAANNATNIATDNFPTTADCDLSSSDSSLVLQQNDAAAATVTSNTSATPGSSPAPAPAPSPQTASAEPSSLLAIHQQQSPSSCKTNPQKGKKGFSISAILGGGS